MTDSPTSSTVSDGAPLAPLTAGDTAGDVERILRKLDDSRQNKRIIRLLANSATAFRPFVLMTTSLLSSEHFPRLDQEVVILHLAARRGSHYEWEEHVPMALASGVTQEQIDAIERDRGAVDSHRFSADQLLAVAFADEVVEGGRAGRAMWERAIARWTSAGAVDVLMTVGVWGAFVPTIIDGLGLEHAD